MPNRLAKLSNGTVVDLGKSVLLFEDDFLGTSLSYATDIGGGTWRTRGYEGYQVTVTKGYSDYAGSSWNVSPIEHPNNSPFSVSNSILTITCRRNPGLTGISNQWLSGYLVSNHITNLTWKYGYFEWRMRLPNPVRGMFPALWLYNGEPTRADGQQAAEIDVFETFGISDGMTWENGWHLSPTPGTNSASIQQRYDITDWHTYGVEWLPWGITFYRDGVAIRTAAPEASPWFETGPKMSIRMDYSMDPSWLTAGDPRLSTSADPAVGVEPRMEIDYVRVWTSKPT